MTAPDAGRVLRRALLAWGLGHLALGRTRAGWAWLAAEVVGVIVVVWLTIGLAESSAYLIPFLAGVTFVAAWAWQAIDAYRSARSLQPAVIEPPQRSAAAQAGWLCLPLLVWGSGFWLIGAPAGHPAAVLDRFITDWSRDELEASAWPDAVIGPAEAAAETLGDRDDRFHDVRIRIVRSDDESATAVAEAIHFERRETRVLGVFPGSELVPVADRTVLRLELIARTVELPGGGDIGAVEWQLREASVP